MAIKDGWQYMLGEVCIALCLVFSVYYFNKARKTDPNMSTLKQLNYGMAILFLFLFITRVLDNPIATFTDPGRGIYLVKDDPSIPLFNAEIYAWARFLDYDVVLVGQITMGYVTNMFFLVGLAIAVFFMERAFIPKARHIFFCFLIACAFVSFLYTPLTGLKIDIFDTNFDDPIAVLFTGLGFLAFAVIPLIYWVLAGKTTGVLRRNAILLGIGFLAVLADIHTVGHESSGYWYRSAICILGFVFIGLGNRNR
ncbi:MAG: hypothetical protein JW839_13555 [Candidatus Lokiarchaeota archaeon]|nr:hypothetical protein [Candidatus Lokiarchaeota archaeon]